MVKKKNLLPLKSLTSNYIIIYINSIINICKIIQFWIFLNKIKLYKKKKINYFYFPTNITLSLFYLII